MMIKLIVIILAILGVIFVVMPFFNRGVFDFQCEKSGCSGEICQARKIMPSESVSTTCEFKPEYGCLKGCGVQSYRCGFEAEFEKSCVDCVKKCESSGKNSENLDLCFKACYSKYNETAAS